MSSSSEAALALPAEARGLAGIINVCFKNSPEGVCLWWLILQKTCAFGRGLWVSRLIERSGHMA